MEKQEKDGFTIIEVALVLAIAGLIFLMVFIALPQMRRSQRDSERKDEIMTFVETLKKYQTNNRGALPEGLVEGLKRSDPRDADDQTSWLAFYNDYLEEKFTDPSSGENYLLTVRQCATDSAVKRGDMCSDYEAPEFLDYTMYIYKQGTCQEDYPVLSANPRDFVVIYRTESSGVFCYNS